MVEIALEILCAIILVGMGGITLLAYVLVKVDKVNKPKCSHDYSHSWWLNKNGKRFIIKECNKCGYLISNKPIIK